MNISRDLTQLAGQPIIIGAGIAGLMVALELAPQPVVLLSAGPVGGEASSILAQGGLAASLGADDSPELHLADTLAAGDGLCDPAMARLIIEAAPAGIARLEQLGVRFDRDAQGHLALALEAAHSRHRIIHAGGDATGQKIMLALVEAVRSTPSITVLDGFAARRLIIENNAIAGVLAANHSETTLLATSRVVLATGGIGGLFSDTTNPLGCFGQGLALAARAGAELADLEFVQFHPTALDGATRPMRLVSEAVRGEGAALVDETGLRFLADLPGAELSTRDEVARGVFGHLAQGHSVYLDTRACLGNRFAERFPAINAYCQEAGIDPSRNPIPVRPAAHYHMGGVTVDAEGRSSLRGLWACGEVASTGLHGANRLASNSLIEAIVTAGFVAQSVAATAPSANLRLTVSEMPLAPTPGPVRDIASASLGVIRHGDGLRDAIASLLPLAKGDSASADPAAIALMMAVSALQREESRGAHYRLDHPARLATPSHSRLTLEEAISIAEHLNSAPLARSA